MRADANWIPATIRAVRDLTPEIREFTLAPEGGAGHYPTGSHLRLEVLADGRAEIRHYSLVGDAPKDGSWRIAVKREEPGKGGSRYMWSLPVGGRLVVAPPDSHFQLSRRLPEALLIAGGIGVTPILGMAEALLRRGTPFRMLYGGRSRDGMAYLPELEALLGDRLVVATDDSGVRLDLAGEIARLHPEGEAYVCGPIGLLDAARRAWAASGRPLARLVFETFGSSGRHAPEPFTVRVPRFGIEVTVPENTTMLAALESAGVELLYDCRRGECGLCALDVVEVQGTIDHRDVFFSDHEHAEGKRLCACVSRVVGGGITVDPPYRGDAALTPGIEGQRASERGVAPPA